MGLSTFSSIWSFFYNYNLIKINFCIKIFDMNKNLVGIIFLLLTSCNEKEKEFYLYPDLINNNQTFIMRIDTITCYSSTIILDSFPTSGNKKMLIGYFNDSIIGSVRCMSAFQLGLPSIYPSENDRIDSASLFLVLDGYSYGDTTKSCKYEIYTLTEFPEPDENGYCYNTVSLKYGNKIGERELRISPKIINEISIPITNDFSEVLFYGLITKDIYFKYDEDFLKFLPGIVIISDTNKTNSIIRFLSSSGNAYLRLFLSKKELMNENYYIDFPIINTSNQFNIISRNFKSWLINYDSNKDKKIKSENTNYTSFINSGYGIYTRIDFPFLNELFSYNNFKVLKAILNFRPKIIYTNIYELSDSLISGQVGYGNKIQSIFYNSEGSYLLPSLNIDVLYNQETQYTLDITSFISSGFDNKWFNPDEGIFLTFHPNFQYITFKNLSIDAKSLQLILYILKY